jgi:hypothetical protein
MDLVDLMENQATLRSPFSSLNSFEFELGSARFDSDRNSGRAPISGNRNPVIDGLAPAQRPSYAGNAARHMSLGIAVAWL